MDLFVIRHGQSEADILNVIEGRADFPLTDLGRKQAEAMAAWMGGRYKISHIITSPLLRAKQTAEYLSKAANVTIQYDEDLMEWQNGFIAGLSREEAAKKYPPPPVKYPHTKIYGQESLIEFRARAETSLSRVIHENPQDSVMVLLSHGGMINMLFRSFMELPQNTGITLATGDTGIHHWQIHGQEKKIIFTNYREHLTNILMK